MTNHVDEIEMIRRCKQRDLSAFEGLYQLYNQRALRTAYLITRSRPAAEDAVQEAFLEVWRGIAGLREEGAFRSWFYRILLSTTHRLGRKERGVVTLPLHGDVADRPDENAPVPEEQAEYEEELRELRAAISLLPETHRIPVVLRYYSRLTDVEIGEVLGIPSGTVKSRLHHARQSLQETMSSTASVSPGSKEGPRHA